LFEEYIANINGRLLQLDLLFLNFEVQVVLILLLLFQVVLLLLLNHLRFVEQKELLLQA
jgi:hypothetical protein